MHALLFVTAALITVPAAAQDHSVHGAHPGSAAEQDHSAHGAPPPPTTQEDHSAHAAPGQDGQHDGHPPAGGQTPTEDAASAGAMPHGAMGHEAQEPMDHGSMEHMDQGGATSAPPPSEPPPRALEGPRHAADAISGADAMAAPRDELAVMDDFTLATIMLERFEARLGAGRSGERRLGKEGVSRWRPR